jgi:NodT family efflux transporter outer membrane factor (OMF) lipoprotein
LTLQTAGVRILEARAQLGIAIGDFYPQKQQLNAAYSRITASRNAANRSSPGFDAYYNDFQGSFDAGWELDFWGKFRRGIQSANADLFGSIADYDDLLVALLAEVARTYVLIRTTEERLSYARDNVKIQARSLEITEVLFRNGAVTELDVQEAKALLKNTEALIPVLETDLQQSKNALSILLGMPPGDLDEMLGEPGPIPKAPLEVAVGIPAELLRRRPDIQRAEFNAAAQSALIGYSKADLYPHFSLLGSIGLQADDMGDFFARKSTAGSIGPSFSWDIFNYGRIKNQVRVQDARLQELIITYQNTVLQAQQEVEDSLVGFLKSQEEEECLADSVDASRRAVDLALLQYRDGAVDYTRVLNTQSALVDSEDNLASTRGNIVTFLIAAYKALGGGWQIRGEDAFVPEKTKEEMRNRTNWGGLLEPEALDVPPPSDKKKLIRKPDW